jgi:hypothetical protein
MPSARRGQSGCRWCSGLQYPPGQLTLVYDAGSAPLCRGMISNRPPRPPSGRSWGQARWSGPPTPPSQATQAQDALNQEWRVNRVSPQRQPSGSQAVSAQALSAPSESAQGQYPGWLTGPQYPMPALSAALPLGPSLQGTTKSDSVDIRVA